jgi:hypothetical protein
LVDNFNELERRSSSARDTHSANSNTPSPHKSSSSNKSVVARPVSDVRDRCWVYRHLHCEIAAPKRPPTQLPNNRRWRTWSATQKEYGRSQRWRNPMHLAVSTRKRYCLVSGPRFCTVTQRLHCHATNQSATTQNLASHEPHFSPHFDGS